MLLTPAFAALLGQLTISTALLVAAGAQLQAWALEEEQMRSGISDAPLLGTIWYWLRMTRSVATADPDEHPAALNGRRIRSMLVGWAWLYAGSMLSCTIATAALVSAVARGGPTDLVILCFAAALVVKVGLWFLRQPAWLGWAAPLLLAATGTLLLLA